MPKLQLLYFRTNSNGGSALLSYTDNRAYHHYSEDRRRQGIMPADIATPTSTQAIRVLRYGIISTNLVVHSAWEPYAGHSTYTTIDGQRMGRIGTRPLPADLDRLTPRSEARYRAVKAWYAQEYQEAYAAIVEAFPGSQDGKRSMGEITITATETE